MFNVHKVKKKIKNAECDLKKSLIPTFPSIALPRMRLLLLCLFGD